MTLLGIDIGTSGSRALLLDEAGQTRSASADHEAFRSPRSGWAEQDPEDWWRACQIAVAKVLSESGTNASAIQAIGLSGQMHGAVLLDEAGAVVRPSIIWCDQRTDTECRWIESTVGASRLLELTSNPALTNFTLTKLLWVRTHEPELWSRVRHVLLPKDYIRWRMSGEHAIDVADASGTLMLDVAQRRWSADLLERVGIDLRLLPRVFESPDICARVSPAAASALGVPVGTPIVAGAGDQAAGAVGMGITRPGAVSATIGTSGVVFAATDRPITDPKGRLHTFCHAVPGRWHVMGVTQAAGLSLRWLRDLVGATGGVTYDDLTAEAARVAPGAEGVLWAPYLMGERTPHCDPAIRAALVGLAANHGRGHVVRAVLEGVAFSLRDTFTIFSELSVPVDRIVVGGGGARSALWRTIQASVYRRPVETLAADGGAAYGAAIWPASARAPGRASTKRWTRSSRRETTTSPDAESVDVMNERYAHYRRMYAALRSIAEDTETVVAQGFSPASSQP
jgi:xylulokinase